ncbi:sensor histidine kinase, partial [Liquorilactobacillus hordei]
TNALKYGAGAKTIWISAKKVSEKEIVVSIANDGKAIPKKSLARLFDRFYRVESSRSKETGGSGLGLAISLSIVELHHGYIYAESDDKLTNFIMHFPINQEVELQREKVEEKN